MLMILHISCFFILCKKYQMLTKSFSSPNLWLESICPLVLNTCRTYKIKKKLWGSKIFKKKQLNDWKQIKYVSCVYRSYTWKVHLKIDGYVLEHVILYNTYIRRFWCIRTCHFVKSIFWGFSDLEYVIQYNTDLKFY